MLDSWTTHLQKQKQVSLSINKCWLAERLRKGDSVSIEFQLTEWKSRRVEPPENCHYPNNSLISPQFHPTSEEKQRLDQRDGSTFKGAYQSPVPNTHVWQFKPITSGPGNLKPSFGL